MVILDEAQCLPVQYLKLCLDVLRELTARYRTTAVLYTATQPEIWRTDAFPIGLENVREIIPQPTKLHEILRRVKVTEHGTMDDATLAGEIAACRQVLVIVNTHKYAQTLFRRLPECDANFHLSALMCPTHRQLVLATVRARLKDRLPVRLISTQLIEAGVDVDFPKVYRALAGIDSIAQATGRCNRNGEQSLGEFHVFLSEHYGPRVQNSVFECLVDLAQLVAMRPRLLGIIDMRSDSLRIYNLGEEWNRRVEHHGIKAGIDPQGPLIA